MINTKILIIAFGIVYTLGILTPKYFKKLMTYLVDKYATKIK